MRIFFLVNIAEGSVENKGSVVPVSHTIIKTKQTGRKAGFGDKDHYLYLFYLQGASYNGSFLWVYIIIIHPGVP